MPWIRSSPVLWPLAALCLALACASELPSPDHPLRARPGAPPTAAFFADPQLSQLALSPDGERLAAITTRDGVQVLIDKPARGDEIRYLKKFGSRNAEVRSVGWSGRDMIVVGVEKPELQRLGDARWVEMLAIQLRTWRPRIHGPGWTYPTHPDLDDGVIDWLPDDPEHVLVNRWESGLEGATARRIRVRDGIEEVVVLPEPWVSRWFADAQGRVRAASGLDPESLFEMVTARPSADAPFEPLDAGNLFEESSTEFAGFGRADEVIYLRAFQESGRLALYAYDLGRRERRLVYAHPEVDVGAVVSSSTDGRVLAVAVDGDRPGFHFFDEAARLEQASLDATFPGATTRVVGRDRSGDTGIVQVSGDTKPPEFYLYDRDARQLDFLFSRHPELDSEQLAPMRPVRYSARDGREIPAYLTLPQGVPPERLPTVVVPHDGPTARDHWGWHTTAQFLASRGFAVFQPNFRGSSGYGRDHESAGYRQWGLAMQDDLEDGVAWLVGEGVADPARVGIYGVGYGGYAALMGLVKTPELYRAGASRGGVTDLLGLLENPDHYRVDDFNAPVIGSTRRDRERLEATSPARRAGRIRAPVLIAHGERDAAVHPDQARAMVDALEAAGRDYELHLYRGEAREFRDERNRIDFHEKLAAFFERHLMTPRAL